MRVATSQKSPLSTNASVAELGGGVTACALATAGIVVAASVQGVSGLIAPVDPIAWPAVPAVAVLAILISALPAVITPPVPDSARGSRT